ncbi:MAG: hypothetical protein Q8S13_07920, partial [Dehalococcoidia bacterium]|nr:hypothetical protein [Dehalococcoidia bacterium]
MIGERPGEIAEFAKLVQGFPAPWTATDRPTGDQITALRARAELVILPPIADVVFAWAAALRAPGSTLLVRDAPPDSACARLDFARVGCRAETTPMGLVVVRGEGPVLAARSGTLSKRPRPDRPLRSVFLGDLTYCSAYRLGVAQGVYQLGGLHRDVSIRDEAASMDRQVRELRPDLIFTHMLLWPPANGQTPLPDLIGMAEMWRRQGAAVLVHDGDPRAFTRFPHDVSASVDLALLNHTRPVPEWNVPTLHWPYAAFAQARIAAPVPEFRADLAFAGLLREGDLYGPRSECVRALQDRIGMRVYPEAGGYNNRFEIAAVAAS